ncbi:MAG: AAA family ATPase [Chloroflexi bacterium]|nr:AAA family ATPase [Chloroflexota bacterium]
MPRGQALGLARLDQLLADAWEHRLTLIVAPAGSGKSTLLARFVADAPGPVAWYRADAWDRDPVRMLRHLERALRSVLPDLSSGWETVDDAIEALGRVRAERLLLVIDDLHALGATTAERDLERLLDRAPPGITVVAASRAWPDMNLPRFKVAGELLEIGVDDLRFRSWEVEQLFRDLYGQPLPPEEVATLTRRTEGWAAGLQLFHLATRGKSPAERRQVLERMARPASRLTGDYLSRNVLAELPGELGEFLMGTCVLGRLSGRVCDELLGRTDSIGVLRDLEARCLFTLPLAEPDAWRYHEVFRLHLLGMLVDSLGEDEVRRRHRHAGELLAGAGALPEALDALCRAEAWEAVAELLGRDGSMLAGSVSAWTDAIPPSMLRADPWLMLARARAFRAQGRWRAAADTYADAQAVFGESDGASIAAQERAPLVPWLDPDPPRITLDDLGTSRSASLVLRAATIRFPGSLANRPSAVEPPMDLLVQGVVCLLAGEPTPAAERFERVLATGSDALVTAAASLGRGVARLLTGASDGLPDIEQAVSVAEDARIEWLERLARACLALGDGNADARMIADAAAGSSDAWGAAIAGAIDGWTTHDQDARPELLGRAATAFRRLGAPVLEAWLRAAQAAALASLDHPESEQIALGADALARTTGVTPARGLAQLALAHARGRADDELGEAALTALRESGLGRLADTLSGRLSTAVVTVGHTGGATGPGGAVMPGVPAHGDRGATLEARCFGPLELIIDGHPVDLGATRPRVRSLLRLLLSAPGEPFHHEVITETFWPDAPPEVGARNLHAAVAALRRLVEPGATRGGFRLVVREGSAYRFVIPADAHVDLVRFDAAVAGARVARATGDEAAAELHLREALACHRGELLADEGPATWLEEAREHRRQQAVAAAVSIATRSLDRGDLDDAAQVCADGLRIDRYHDPLWRTLIEIRERAGDAGAARQARRSYDRVLTELGVSGPSG